MKREDHRTDDDLLKRLEARNRIYRAGSAMFVGFVTAVLLAGCVSAMGIMTTVPEDSTAAYENELTASLGLGSEPESTWNTTTDGSALNLAPEYTEAQKSATVVLAGDGSGSGSSRDRITRRIVHPDDYLGDSTDVGKAFTSAVVDDTLNHSADTESNTVSFW